MAWRRAGEKVTAEILHIDTLVADALRPVDKGGHACFPGEAAEFSGGIFESQGIGDMDKGEELRFLAVCGIEQGFRRIEIQG